VTRDRGLLLHGGPAVQVEPDGQVHGFVDELRGNIDDETPHKSLNHYSQGALINFLSLHGVIPRP
jgi:hypothetical protein